MTEKEKQIHQMAEIISSSNPVSPFSLKKANELWEAGYRLPAPLSPISKADLEVRVFLNEIASWPQQAIIFDSKFTNRVARRADRILAQLAADRKATGAYAINQESNAR